MPQNKKQDPIQAAKNQSMTDESHDSLNSETGYEDTGNDAQLQAKSRAYTRSNNGKHM